MAEILPEQAVDDENVSTFDFLEMFCQEFSILKKNLVNIVNFTENYVNVKMIAIPSFLKVSRMQKKRPKKR